ncbi:MAG: suppressor of fused domain protein [Vulcanimicrobiota bacterium]
MSEHVYYEWIFRHFVKKKNVLSVGYLKMAGLYPWDLLHGRKIEKWNIRNHALCLKDGIREDFVLSTVLVPIHSARLKTFIEEIAPGEVQYLPLKIYKDGREEIEGYYIGNVLRIVDCVDREQMHQDSESKARLPGRSGKLNEKDSIVLNPALVGDAKIFRLKDWEYVLIVRDDVVKEIKKAGFSASRFSRMKMTDSRVSEKEKEARAKLKIQERREDGESSPVSSDRIESGRESTGAIDSELQSMLTGLKERYMPGKELPVPFLEIMSRHISRYIGEPGMVLHEIDSDIVHIDIHCVLPRKGRNFYTLVTSGMSDKSMITPVEASEFRFAELVIYLPATWPLDKEHSRLEEYYWPVRLLKDLTKMPHMLETWLGPGHTIANGEPPEPYAANTRMCGSVLLEPVLEPVGFRRLKASPAKTINYLLVFPLYKEEMIFSMKYGMDILLERLERKRTSPILNISRESLFNVRKRI